MTHNNNPQVQICLTSAQRLEICTWLHENVETVKAGKIAWGKIIDRTEGVMTEKPRECSGVWGYEGDSIAIRVNHQPYPSTAIVQLNYDKLPQEYRNLIVSQFPDAV